MDFYAKSSTTAVIISKNSKNDGRAQKSKPKLGTSSRVGLNQLTQSENFGTTPSRSFPPAVSKEDLREGFRDDVNAIIDQGARVALRKGARLSSTESQTPRSFLEVGAQREDQLPFAPFPQFFKFGFGAYNTMPAPSPMISSNFPFGSPGAQQAGSAGVQGSIGGPSGYAGPMPFPPNYQNHCWGVSPQNRFRTPPVLITSSALALAMLADTYAQSTPSAFCPPPRTPRTACCPTPRQRRKKCRTTGEIIVAKPLYATPLGSAAAAQECSYPEQQGPVQYNGQRGSIDGASMMQTLNSNLITSGMANGTTEVCDNFQVRPYMMIERIAPEIPCAPPPSTNCNNAAQRCCQPPSSLCGKLACCSKNTSACPTPAQACNRPRKKARRCSKAKYLPLPFTPPVVMINCSADPADEEKTNEQNKKF